MTDEKRLSEMNDKELLRTLFGERAVEKLEREIREQEPAPESETDAKLPPMQAD